MRGMTAPNELSATSWASTLAALIRHGADQTDPRVRECRAGLAYWRGKSALGPEVVNALDDVGRDLLIAVLRGDQDVPAPSTPLATSMPTVKNGVTA